MFLKGKYKRLKKLNNSPIKNKVTLGVQTTADGLVYRGVASDTTLTVKSDTAAYFVLDTVNLNLYTYKISASGKKWIQLGSDTTSLNLVSRFATKLNISDTASMLTPYWRADRFSGTLPVANGGTNTSTAFTAGSVVFAGSGGTYTQANEDIRFITADKRLVLGPNTIVSPETPAFNGVRFKSMGKIQIARSDEDTRFISIDNEGGEAKMNFKAPGAGYGSFKFTQSNNADTRTILHITGDGNFGVNEDVAANITQKLTVVGNGLFTQNLGVGGVTPTSRLHVKGVDGTSTNSALNVTNSSDASLLFVRNDGNVGIGTDNPTFKLDVNGTGIFRGSSATPITSINTGQRELGLFRTSLDGGFMTFQSSGANARGYIGNGGGISSAGETSFGIRSESDLILMSGGNNIRLTIASTGAATFSSSVTSNATTSFSFYSGTYVSNSLGDGSFATYSGRIRENASYNLNIDLYDRNAATWRTPLSFNNTGGAATFSSSVTATQGIFSSEDAININNTNGKIIGGGTTAGRFFFNNTDLTSYFVIYGSAHATNAHDIFYVTNTSNIFTFNNDGNFGVGIGAPTEKFHVVGNARITGNVGIGVTTPTTAIDMVGQIRMTGATIASGLTKNINISGAQNFTDDEVKTISAGNVTFIMVADNNTGGGALFFASYASSTVVEIADPSNFGAVTDLDGFVCVYKNANSATINVKNRLGSTKSITVSQITVGD
jgi:hypothetical protein